jgi:hypothetical protein
MLSGAVFFSLLAFAGALSNRDELFDKYGEIFPNGNRNAASHRWATYILERSASMPEKTIRDLFAGFCSISGSPLSYNRRELRVQMTLPAVYGGTETGMMYYCCSPCVCDTQDFLKVDTKTVNMTDGAKQAHFVVIGNPCKDPTKIPRAAPDVNCDANQQLDKATLSDHGHIIIGMFFEPGIKHHSDSAIKKEDQAAFATMCQSRADAGHNSGMGMIFRVVAAITPITPTQGTKIALPDPVSGIQAAALDSVHSGEDNQEGLMNETSSQKEKSGQADPISSVACMRSVGIEVLLLVIYAVL